MRILVIGATGTIGRRVVEALQNGNDIVPVSHSHTPITVDLGNPSSIHAMYRAVGQVDAVVSAAGKAKFAAFDTLTDEDFAFFPRQQAHGPGQPGQVRSRPCR